MENEWVGTALGGLLPEEEILKIIEDYEACKDRPLLHLGLDSMKTMGLVINIESAYGIDIDYERFHLDEIATLERLKGFIERHR
ncbi:MAG: acyl carrier protein [Nonomuraea sp.]|nr:acyl carrier protein [Nonomuraea sp.]NUS04516.1 acyl carrier protein [Nonomuraea sp.]